MHQVKRQLDIAVSEEGTLNGTSHALSSSPDLAKASQTLMRCVEAAVRDEPIAIRMFFPDDRGRLIPGGPQEGAGPDLAGARRASFRRAEPRIFHLEDSGRAVAMFPLVCRDQAVGLIEVIGRPAAVLRGWRTLEAVTGEFAVVISLLGERERAEREASLQAGLTGLMQDLVKATRPEDAVRAVMTACHHWGYQVAAWLVDDRPAELRFLGVRGIGRNGRGELRSRMGVIKRNDLSGSRGRDDLAHRFGAVVGAREVAVIGSRDAVLALAGVPRSSRSFLQVVASILDDILHHLAIVSLADARNQNLDLGLAWTAHELRQPLVSVRLFVDRLLHTVGRSDNDRIWLTDSLHELERLISLVEDVLRWSVGRNGTARETVDIAALVKELARPHPERIRLDAPDPLMVSADTEQLAAAIRNLIDNGLAYSPDKIDVAVDRTEKGVVVSVKDYGPGIPRAEQRLIFDPFVRGETGRAVRKGTGLGLFIARRIAEAHGGTIWVESNGKGAAFKISLPTGASER